MRLIKSIAELFLGVGADPTVTAEWDGREIDLSAGGGVFAAYVPDPPTLTPCPPDPPTVNMDALTIAATCPRATT